MVSKHEFHCFAFNSQTYFQDTTQGLKIAGNKTKNRSSTVEKVYTRQHHQYNTKYCQKSVQKGPEQVQITKEVFRKVTIAHLKAFMNKYSQEQTRIMHL